MVYIPPNGLYPLFLEASGVDLLGGLIDFVMEAPVAILILLSFFYFPYSWVIKKLHPTSHPTTILRKEKPTPADWFNVAEYILGCIFIGICVLLGTIRLVFLMEQSTMDPSNLSSLWLSVIMYYAVITFALVVVYYVLIQTLRKLKTWFPNKLQALRNKIDKRKENRTSRKRRIKSFFSRILKRKKTPVGTTGEHPREEADK